MHSLGVRLVVVHEQNTFNSEPLTPIAVTQALADTLAERTHIEQMFSMGLPELTPAQCETQSDFG
jgi:hypothetical protein